MADLTESSHLLCFLICILVVNQANGNQDFRGLSFHRNNIVRLSLGDGSHYVNTNHFKLAWTKNGASQINYNEYHVTGSYLSSRPMYHEHHNGDINNCYAECLREEKCRLIIWKTDGGSKCSKYESSAVYPTPTLPLSIAPQLVRFIQRRFSHDKNVAVWPTHMTFLYLRLEPMVRYNLSFVQPYNSASTTNWRSFMATEQDPGDSYFQYSCKAATIRYEPIICRVVTDFTYLPDRIIDGPNRLIIDSGSANSSNNQWLGNGLVTYVKKFYYSAAGTYRVQMQAVKEFAPTNTFYDTSHRIVDTTYEFYLGNDLSFGLTQEVGVMYNFTICLRAHAPETVFVYPNDGSNLNIALTVVAYTTKPRWHHNWYHQVSSSSTSSETIANVTSKEFFIFKTFLTDVKVYKNLKLFAVTPGEIQINWGTFKSCSGSANCYNRLIASTQSSSDELDYYYSKKVNLTAGYNFVNLSDSSGVPITSVANTIITWTSLGGMLGVTWIDNYWLESDMILDTSNNTNTYRSLNTYNSSVRLATEKASFLVDLEIEYLTNAYCYNMNHTYDESILDRGTSYPLNVFVESQRTDSVKPVIRTITFNIIKITCPATVETYTSFRCTVRMYKEPKNRYPSYSFKRFNMTVAYGTTPQISYNWISSRGYPSYWLRNVDHTINTAGTFTITASETDWAVQDNTTITVTQRTLIQFACPASVQAFDEIKCNITMQLDPPTGETNHNVTVTYGANRVSPVNVEAVFPRGWGSTRNKHQVTSTIDEVGQYTVSAYSHYYNQNVSVTVNITRVIGFSFGQTKAVITAIFDNPNNTGQDPIASLSDANPQLLLDILSLPGQDMGGCLSNCSNKGKCTMNDQNKFVCECQEFYRGSMCEIDIRGCTPKPCQNNGTCTEVIIPGQLDQGFTCNCSSPVFFGVRCEQKVNVCWNKTCNFNGKCFDNSTIPTCKCFKYYSGEDCEIKSEELQAMKQTAAVASVVAITMVTGFYISIFVSDYFGLAHATVMALFA